MKNLKKPIVVIGGGSIGKRHINNLHKLGFVNVYCLKRFRDAKFESENDVRVITSEREFITLNPFIVFIATPTSIHIDGLELAIKVNAHIFMEKPFISNAVKLNRAKNLLAKYEKVFMIGYMLRFHPLVIQIKKIIDDKEIGKVISARFEFGSYLPFWHPNEDYRFSYAARKELGGGVLNTISHELDLIYYFFGLPNSVFSNKLNTGILNIDVEDLFEGVLIYQDKLISLHLDYLQKDYDRRIAVICENGKLTWNWHDNEVILNKFEDINKVIPLKNFDINELYINEIRHFLTLIEKNNICHSLDYDYAIKNTYLLLDLHNSAEIGKKLKINKNK